MALDPLKLTIGTLSRQTGIKVETVRYYERIELLPPPVRTEGGHRLYKDEDLNRLQFIKRCRELGFSIEDIRAFLSMLDGGDYTCCEVKDMAQRHLQEISEKIADLKKLQTTLDQLSAQCTGSATPQCALLDSLFEG